MLVRDDLSTHTTRVMAEVIASPPSTRSRRAALGVDDQVETWSASSGTRSVVRMGRHIDQLIRGTSAGLDEDVTGR